jgi:hypothetical protein
MYLLPEHMQRSHRANPMDGPRLEAASTLEVTPLYRQESIFVPAGLVLPCSVKSVSSLMCLLRRSCALSRIVVRKKILNYRAYAGFIEHVKQFVRARRAPKIIFFWDARIIWTVRNGHRTACDLLIRRES